MKLLVSLALLGLSTVMAAPVDPLENDLFKGSAEYDEDCVEDVQAANFEPPAIFKDEFEPFADEKEDDCEDYPAEEGDLDEAFNLGDINDEFSPQKDEFIAPAFQSDEVAYPFDEECEEEEISQAEADDSLLAFAAPQKDEMPVAFSDSFGDEEADCYDENADDAAGLDEPAFQKDEYFDFDNVLDNVAAAQFAQSDTLEEDCVDEEDGFEGEDEFGAEEFDFGDEADVKG